MAERLSFQYAFHPPCFQEGSLADSCPPRSLISGFTTFPIPAPYSPRVRSALNASPISVALSGLVGAQGWWYTFGSRIFGLLEERQGREGREVLRRVSRRVERGASERD